MTLEVTPYGTRTDTIQENIVKFEKHVDADVRSAAPEVGLAAE